MNISELTDQEKSVLLAKAMDKYENVALLAVVDALVDGDRKHYWQDDGVIEQIPDLYDPANMALAWRCHLWRVENDPLPCTVKGYVYWWNNLGITRKPDAQRLWLDKILSLAIEGGLVELEGVEELT